MRPGDPTPPTGETLYRGRKYELRLIERPLNTGEVRQWPVIVHHGSVVIAALHEDGLVLIENDRHTLGRRCWELPAGTLEVDADGVVEDPLGAAPRELIEETGFAAAKLEPRGGFYAAPGLTNEWMYLFIATDLRHVGQRLEPDERITARVVPWDEVGRMVADGRLADAKSLAALALGIRPR